MLENPEVIMNIPAELWYLLSCVLAVALFWIIKMSVVEQKKFNKELSDTMKDIKSILKLHEWRLDKLEENNGSKAK